MNIGVRCVSRFLGFPFLCTLELMQTERVRKYFDSRASSYADDSNRGIWKTIRSHEMAAVKEALNDRKFDSILELGCGSGYYTYELASYTDQMEIVDVSEAMLNSVRISNVNKIHRNFVDYKPNSKFQLIFCAGALEYVKDPLEVLKRYVQYLTADGEFLLLLPRNNIFGILYRSYYFFKKINIELFSQEPIRSFCDKMGLELKYLKVGFPFFYVMQLKKLD